MSTTFDPPAPPYVGPAKWHGPGTNKPIRRIVIHATAGAEPGVKGAAKGTVSYSKSTTRASSFHYVADAAGSLQYVYDSLVAYHDGTNTHSLGYELCCSLSNEGKGHWARPDHQAMLKVAAADIAGLCLAYSIPVRRLTPTEIREDKMGLCGHVDMRDAYPSHTTHWDPGPHFPWDDFLALIRDEVDARTHPAPVPGPGQIPPPHTHPLGVFKFGHQSGRFDAPTKSVQAAVKQMLDVRATIITGTEAQRRGLVDAITPDGWESAQSPDAEAANTYIMWDTTEFEVVVGPWWTALSETAFYTTKGHQQPLVWATAVVLRHHGTGLVAAVAVLHAPPSIEGRDGYEGPPRRVEAHKETVSNVSDIWQPARDELGAGEFAKILAADWNLDANREWVQALWDETFPRMIPSYAHNQTGDSTHGNRRIDWVFASQGHKGGPQLEVMADKVMPKVKDLDHAGVICKIGVLSTGA